MEVNKHFRGTNVEWNVHCWDVMAYSFFVVFLKKALQIFIFLIFIYFIELNKFFVKSEFFLSYFLLIKGHAWFFDAPIGSLKCVDRLSYRIFFLDLT
jgi:hypothetical protein